MARSDTHLVLIPSYNPGATVVDTVHRARDEWEPVWVVVDGSDDGSAQVLQSMADTDPGLRVIVLPRNAGKGAAVLHGMAQARKQGFTHALTMDSDGQHSAQSIGEFMAQSLAHPECLILGVPRFGADAPRLRVRGRRISNWWAGV
jgi:glycosyltransferase involved in cell wall biosynthesis